MKNSSLNNSSHHVLCTENLFLAAAALQLVVLSPINYFMFLPTNFIRWGIDTCLYTFALIVLIRLSVKTGFKPDKIIFLYIALFMVNILSYVANSPGRLTMIKQIRFTFMGGMIYILLLHGGFTREFFERLLKIIFLAGYIQLPLVIIQLLIYNDVYTRYSGPIAGYVDYAAGSVAYSDSGALGTFLVILAIVKIQQGIEYGFKPLTIMQLLILLAPLGLINSDAQFFFVPLVIAFATFINKKLTKRIFQMVAVSLIVFFVVNSLLLYNWEGARSITRYMTGYLINEIFNMPDRYDSDRLLRHESIKYVWEADTENPGMHILFGKGPGYWLTRDSEGGGSSITNVWYHCNTVLLMYGELGLGGLAVFLLMPLVIYLDTDNSHWGKIIKIEAFYLFLSLFYQHPFNELTLAITSMAFVVYYHRFEMKKQTPVIIRQATFKNNVQPAALNNRRPVRVGV
jgi:hypothetical protein